MIEIGVNKSSEYFHCRLHGYSLQVDGPVPWYIHQRPTGEINVHAMETEAVRYASPIT
jgi:hypothetical protein